jgi:hypothetical protein
MVKISFTVLFILLFSFVMNAQDTFYVKKKQPVQVTNSQRPAWTADNNDSIVSYTMEFQKPGSNVFVVVHEKGPYLKIPYEAYGPNGHVRIIYTEIIAIDQNGVRYRQPDLVRYNGITVPLKETK